MGYHIFESRTVHNVLKKCFDSEQRNRYDLLLKQIVRFQGNAGTFLGAAADDVASYIGKRKMPAAAAYRDVSFILAGPRAADGTVVFVAYYKGPPVGPIKDQCVPIPTRELRHDDITIHDTSVIRRRPRT
jgi:hypothetical protein